jgi:TorA maturation chaperone TorD
MFQDFSKTVLSSAFHFYAKALAFPYDEMTHEFQYIFREMEKYCENEYDQAISNKTLDIINFYQGEELLDLHGEYSRLFSFIENEEPRVPTNLISYDAAIDTDELFDLFEESGILFDLTEDIDTFQNLLDYFSYLILNAETEEEIIEFYLRYMQSNVPKFCRILNQSTTLNFYKEYSNALSELIRSIGE